MREQEIITLLKQRKEEGMDALLLHYGPLMKYIIAPIVADPQDREECLSDVILRIWEKIGQYDPERGSWNAWLTAIARNTALNCRRRPDVLNRAEEIPEDAPSPDPGPEEILIRQERQAALAAALVKLPTRDRVLFYRKYYYLQSTAQIAAEMGLSERAVEGRLYRLKKQLRRMLGGEAHE